MQSDETLSMLRDAAKAFAKPDAKRTRALRGTAGLDRAKWRDIADQGWLAVLVPEARGGLGLDMAAAAAIARALGYGLFPEPYSASLAAGVCLANASDDARLAAFIAGDALVSLAWQNDAGSIEIGATAVSADGSTLSGSCRFVSPADAYVVAARAGSDVALYWVDGNAKGFSATEEKRADGGMALRLGFDRTPAEPIARGTELLAEALNVALVATSAELVGNLERMLEMTMDYLRTRQQFGKVIGSFQALQHRAVDLWIQGELAKAALDSACRTLGDPKSTSAERARAASGAKARVSDAAMQIGKQAIQLHGAIGMTDEYDLGLYFNRALTLSAMLGNALEHRRRYDALQEAA